ncbi:MULTISPECIES: hypothetical protein [Pacificibacter]|uniref:hypothetical protein n=1 Tax=Pacificibacter TaxID=1042323 RepID=UPI001C0A182C|nr:MULTISPECIES: hypothetical protein [Pacificibacter]MBU2935925.1 hypothetical protein [Pacificibacter marinus]MDO6614420.1 hypothetical protein [Pacificibacter sp. 1_MG-2023]
MENSISQKSEQLATLMSERLGIHAGSGFEAKLRKAGRALPRWARRDGKLIVEAMALETHPKLARTVDVKPVDRAIRNLTGHLEGIDPFKRRMGRFLDALALIALIVILIFGAIVAILVWRGLL